MAQTKHNAISVKGFGTPSNDGTVKFKFKQFDMNTVLPIAALLGAVMLWGRIICCHENSPWSADAFGGHVVENGCRVWWLFFHFFQSSFLNAINPEIGKF